MLSYLKRIPTTLPRYLLGVSLLICVCFIWVLSSQLIQTIFTDLEFNQPFFLTYFSTTMFAIYIPILYGMRLMRQGVVALWHCVTDFMANKRRRRPTLQTSVSPVDKVEQMTVPRDSMDSSHADQDEDTALIGARATSLDLSAISQSLLDVAQTRPSQSLTYIIITAAILCPFWLFTNFAFNFSLKKTSVTSNTVISNTSSAFCFLAGIVIGVDHLSFTRVFSIVLALSGVLCITLTDRNIQHDVNDSIFGDLLAALSACSYGCYTSALTFLLEPPELDPTTDSNAQEITTQSHQLNSPLDDPVAHGIPPHSQLSNQSDSSSLSSSTTESSIHDYVQKPESQLSTKSAIADAQKMMLLFGFIGAINGCTAWIFILVAHYTGVERFHMIPSWNVFFSLALNALIGTVLSDFLWAWSVLLTSGVVSTLSLCLTIPLAALTDVILGKKELQFSFVLGAAIVIAAFLICNASYHYPERLRRLDSPNFLRCTRITLHRWYWKRYILHQSAKSNFVSDVDDL